MLRLAEGIDSWNNVKSELRRRLSQLRRFCKIGREPRIMDILLRSIPYLKKEKWNFRRTPLIHKLSKITGVAFIPQYTFGEKMEKAVS